MGLLDDAIREHLELKRLSGADPSEVARQELEALGPVRHADDQPPVEDRYHPETGTATEAARRGDAWEDGTSDPTETERDDRGPVDIAAEDTSAAGQATAEIDMRAVFEADANADDLWMTRGERGDSQAAWASGELGA